MGDKPKQPPADMTRRLAEQTRRDNQKGKNMPDPKETARIAGHPKKGK